MLFGSSCSDLRCAWCSRVPAAAVDLPSGLQYTNFFFAYVCKKQPLQLSQYHGQKAALPNGWVAGSKELFQK